MIHAVLSALLSVAALFVITKLMGHKQVAQLDFFDYVSGITIGSIGAELSTELEQPLKPLIALAVYGGVSVLLTWLTHKFPRTRRYINGEPTVLMSGGKLYRRRLKRAKLDLSEFLLLCREQGYFDPEEIETAVYEYNGKLSVLPKAIARPLTPKDAAVPVTPASMGVEIIMDGRIIAKNLARVGRDERWLHRQLEQQGFSRATEIFLGMFFEDKEQPVLYPNEE